MITRPFNNKLLLVNILALTVSGWLLNSNIGPAWTSGTGIVITILWVFLIGDDLEDRVHKRFYSVALLVSSIWPLLVLAVILVTLYNTDHPNNTDHPKPQSYNLYNQSGSAQYIYSDSGYNAATIGVIQPGKGLNYTGLNIDVWLQVSWKGGLGYVNKFDMLTRGIRLRRMKEYYLSNLIDEYYPEELARVKKKRKARYQDISKRAKAGRDKVANAKRNREINSRKAYNQFVDLANEFELGAMFSELGFVIGTDNRLLIKVRNHWHIAPKPTRQEWAYRIWQMWSALCVKNKLETNPDLCGIRIENETGMEVGGSGFILGSSIDVID